jgi:hypothetical protein
MFALGVLAGFVRLAYEPIRKLRKNRKNQQQRLTLREIFTLQPNMVDAGLPADDYAGHTPDFMLRVFGLIDDIRMERRALWRSIRTRIQ